MKAYILKTELLFIFSVLAILSTIFFGSGLIAIFSNVINIPYAGKLNLNLDYSYLSKNISENPYKNYETIYKNLGLVFTDNLESHSLPVLYYHGINDNNDEESISFEEFRNQMYALKANGYRTITLSQLQVFLYNGKRLPNKSFLLTFDDGRKDSYYASDPVLAEVGYNAIMFIIGSTLETNNSFHLNANEVKKMIKTGRWEIGSHSYLLHKLSKIDADGSEGHSMANKLWLSDKKRIESDDEFKKRIWDDLSKSKEDLEQRFKVRINTFAFPFGDMAQYKTNCPQCNKYILDITKELFDMSFYQNWGSTSKSNYQNPDDELVRRIGSEEYKTPESLVWLMDSIIDKSLPYTDTLVTNNGWVNKGGKYFLGNGNLTISPDSTNSEAEVYLLGTELWKNFRFTVYSKLSNSGTISLRVFTSNDGSVSCNFSKYSVTSTKKSGSQTTISKSQRVNTALSGPNVTLGISVKNTDFFCIYKGTKILSDKLNGTIRGSIAIGINPETNNSSLEITSIEVIPN